jgi:parvulin-like peptidyl-prolyl isomerase
MKKTMILMTVILILAAAVFAVDSDRIVVKVNDQIVLQSEVDEALEMAATQLKLSGKTSDTAGLKTRITEGLVEQKLIITMAKDENIAVSDEAVADKVNEYLDGLRAKFPSEQGFEDALQQEGLSYTDFRIKIEAQVRDNLIYGKVKQKKQQDFIAKAAVSDEEIKTFYDKNRDMFKEGDEISISQLRFSNGEVETTDLPKYVKDISARIKTEGFEKVFADLTGKKGITTVEPIKIDSMASLDKSVRDAIKNPKKGKVTEPIQIPPAANDNGGYLIVKVTEYKGGKESNLEDVKEKVRVKVIEEKVDSLWNDWIDTVKKEAYIKYM